MKHPAKIPAPATALPSDALREVLAVLRLPAGTRAEACQHQTADWWATAMQLLQEMLNILLLLEQQPTGAQMDGRPGSDTAHARLNVLLGEIHAAEGLDAKAPPA